MLDTLLEPEREEGWAASLNEPPPGRKELIQEERAQNLKFFLILVGGSVVGFGLTGLIVMYLHYHPLSTLFD